MRRLLNFIDQYSSRLLWLMIIFYGLFFSAVSLWKYSHFLYNGLDLAIINNVFYNTLHGHWFWSSIQGHSYLGDHFTPILVLLLPFYALWPSPEILLILQSLFLALAAWPIYKIALKIYSEELATKNPVAQYTGQNDYGVIRHSGTSQDKTHILALVTALLWLINPSVHNANLFEFHFISLLPFLFFSLFYYYLKIETYPRKKLFLCPDFVEGSRLRRSFFALMLLCLMIREDIVFIILLFLILATLSHLKHKPMLRLLGYGWLIAFGWLVISSLVIKHFSPSGSSPFIYYYSWLASANWLKLIQHIFSLANLKMLIGFLLPFLFIPLIRPRWLWLALVPLGQIVFSAHGGGALVWKLHYGLLFMPALVIAFIYGFKRANRLLTQWLASRFLLMVILIISNFYLWIDLGPLTLNLRQFNFTPPSVKQLVNSIPPSAAVLSSYEFLPHLSSRQEVYALNYYFLGQQQFASQPYVLAQPPDYLLINFQDLISFQLQFPQLDWTKNIYHSGAQRLNRLLQNYGAVKVAGDTILFKKDAVPKFKLFEQVSRVGTVVNRQPALSFNQHLQLSSFHLSPAAPQQLRLSLDLSLAKPLASAYQLKVSLSDGRRNYQHYLPLAYGLYSVHYEDLIRLNYWLNLPANFNLSRANQLSLRLVKLNGFLVIDKLGTVKLKIDREQSAGQSIKLKIN